MSMDDQVLDPEPGPRKPRSLLTGLLVIAAAITLVAVGVLAVLRKGDDGDRLPSVVPIPTPYYDLIAAAAESCPMLTTPRLAAQIMANSGFEPSASIDGREGIAGLTDEAWQRWLPWPNADRADPDANITALAHQMCDFAGQLRLARTAGEPWHLALAAHRTTLDGVVRVRGVPEDAAPYVMQVDEYEEAYRNAIGGSDPAASPPAVTSTAPPATSVPSPTATQTPSGTPGPTATVSATLSPPTTAPPTTARPTTTTTTTTTTNPPRTPSTPPANGPTGRISGYVGKCVHVAYTNSADNTQIEIYTCNDGPAEVMTMASDGTIRALGKCMDVSNSSTSNGARVVLFTCNGSPSQQWVYSSGQDIVNRQANKCLDVMDKLTYNGAPLQIWDCNGGAHQKWYVPGS